MRSSLGSLDRSLLREASSVLGIDEAGRGALAGPVVVAGALFVRIEDNPLIQDSKLLSRRRREEGAAWVRRHAAAWAVVELGVEVIEEVNILQATRRAMTVLVRSLSRPGTVVVCDAVPPSDPSLEVLAPPRADRSYFCVAAASLLAKVHRDRVLVGLGRRWPGWGWERNAGYGTREHREALDLHGRSFLHRRGFSWRSVLP